MMLASKSSSLVVLDGFLAGTSSWLPRRQSGIPEIPFATPRYGWSSQQSRNVQAPLGSGLFLAQSGQGPRLRAPLATSVPSLGHSGSFHTGSQAASRSAPPSFIPRASSAPTAPAAEGPLSPEALKQQEEARVALLLERLGKLRAEMQRACHGAGVDAFVIPAEDAHQCEYRAPCFERMRYISGFTGSAGTAVVTTNEALLWTDGRYFLQAQQQLPGGWSLMKAGLPGVPSVAEWLAEALPPGSRVAADPFLHTAEREALLRGTLEAKGSFLVHAPRNLVDLVWGRERPAEPLGLLWVHPVEYAGAGVQEKVGALQAQMREAGADVLLTSLLDDVAWLLNLRGRDVPHCPVAISYAAVAEDGAHLFIDQRKLTPEVQAHLAQAGVSLHLYTETLPFIADAVRASKTLWMDPSTASAAMFSAFYAACEGEGEGEGEGERDGEGEEEGARGGEKKRAKGGKKAKGKAKAARGEKKGKGAGAEEPVEERAPGLVTLPCPITLAKACKNAAEIDGMRRAHLRDGAALAQFWAWLEAEVGAGGRALREVEVVEQLERFRAQQPGFIETSFDTIAGANSNGAIIHYKPEAETCGVVDSSTLLLLDSGGQYADGTTDVTRTAHLGTPSDYQRQAFTRVLQGHIALDSAVFPEGTPGFVLDVLARKSLWTIGLDYRHGTGHGVGACLNVHEGPQSVSPRFGNPTPLQPGMVLSNEPGFYHEGLFGIRIENLLVVREERTEFNFGGNTFLGFDRLTLSPMQARMIDLSLMSPEEEAWVDEYHAEVWDKISPLVQGQALEWLRQSTRPLREQQAVTPASADAQALPALK